MKSASEKETGTTTAEISEIREKEDINKRFEENLGLVVFVLTRTNTGNLSFNDAFQEGSIGLLSAIKNYDPQKSAFSTYASIRIKGAIQDAVIKDSPLTAHTIKTLRRMAPTEERLLTEDGVEPSVEKISEKTGIAPETILSVKKQLGRYALRNVDTTSSGNEEGRQGTQIGDSDPLSSPQEALAIRGQAEDLESQKVRIKSVLSQLSERESKILEMYFWDGLVLGSIGKSLGISESRATQIRNRALKKLRALLADLGPGNAG